MMADNSNAPAAPDYLKPGGAAQWLTDPFGTLGQKIGGAIADFSEHHPGAISAATDPTGTSFGEYLGESGVEEFTPAPKGMVRRTVYGPNGTEYNVTVPEKASQKDVMAFVQQQIEQGNAPRDLPKSQELGLEKGFFDPWDRAAAALNAAVRAIPRIGEPIANAIDEAGNVVGAQPTDAVQAYRDAYFKDRESSEAPGKLGEFAGNTIATAPIALVTKNPWAVGALTAGLTGQARDPLGIAFEMGVGGLTGKAAHSGLGFVGTKLNPHLNNAQAKGIEFIQRWAYHQGKSVDDLIAYGSKMFGKPVMAAEAWGKRGMGFLKSLGSRAGATETSLEGQLTARQAGHVERAFDDVTDKLGISPETARGDLDAVVRQGQEESGPLYDAAYAAPPVLTPAMKHMMSAQETGPDIMAGMKHGIAIARAEHEVEMNNFLAKTGEYAPGGPKFGHPAPPPWDDNAYGVIGWRKVASPEHPPLMPFRPKFGSPTVTHLEPIIGPMPTWRAWDAAKRGLDHALEQYRDPVTKVLPLTKGTKPAILNGLRETLVEHLRQANPAYGAALDRSGDYLSARQAFADGETMLFGTQRADKITEAQFLDKLWKLPPAARQSMEGGVVNRIFNLIQTGKFKASMLATPRAQQKLQMLFGTERAKALTDRLTAEDEIMRNIKRLEPGIGGEHYDESRHFLSEIGHGMMYWAVGMHHAAAFRLGGALKYLVGKSGMMSTEMRDIVGQLVMKTPEELADLMKKQDARLIKFADQLAKWQRAAGYAGGREAPTSIFDVPPEQPDQSDQQGQTKSPNDQQTAPATSP
jgi:hypothetical protein